MVYKNHGIDIGKYYTPAHEDFPKIYDEDIIY